eukprot:364600-Chlamydomonas_euryale.AAC.10
MDCNSKRCKRRWSMRGVKLFRGDVKAMPVWSVQTNVNKCGKKFQAEGFLYSLATLDMHCHATLHMRVAQLALYCAAYCATQGGQAGPYSAPAIFCGSHLPCSASYHEQVR